MGTKQTDLFMRFYEIFQVDLPPLKPQWLVLQERTGKDMLAVTVGMTDGCPSLYMRSLYPHYKSFEEFLILRRSTALVLECSGGKRLMGSDWLELAKHVHEDLPPNAYPEALIKLFLQLHGRRAYAGHFAKADDALVIPKPMDQLRRMLQWFTGLWK